jgi:hypothetical protein
MQAPLLIAQVDRHLAQPRGQCIELLLIGRGRWSWHHPLGFSEPGNHLCVDAICLLQGSHGFGEAPHRAGIGDRCGLSKLPKRQEGRLLEPACGLHHHQICSMLAAELKELSATLLGVGKAPMKPGHEGIQPGFGNIHSTDDVHHGNLPCPYD